MCDMEIDKGVFEKFLRHDYIKWSCAKMDLKAQREKNSSKCRVQTLRIEKMCLSCCIKSRRACSEINIYLYEGKKDEGETSTTICDDDDEEIWEKERFKKNLSPSQQ